MTELQPVTITWDKTDEQIWFGVWRGDEAPAPLYLIAERLPKSHTWDWAVWQPNKPAILRRGTASSPLDAAANAEEAARGLRRVEQSVLGEWCRG
jgi:hypothetical protein